MCPAESYLARFNVDHSNLVRFTRWDHVKMLHCLLSRLNNTNTMNEMTDYINDLIQQCLCYLVTEKGRSPSQVTGAHSCHVDNLQLLSNQTCRTTHMDYRTAPCGCQPSVQVNQFWLPVWLWAVTDHWQHKNTTELHGDRDSRNKVVNAVMETANKWGQILVTQ